jgi:hypothetical protein
MGEVKDAYAQKMKVRLDRWRAEIEKNQPAGEFHAPSRTVTGGPRTTLGNAREEVREAVSSARRVLGGWIRAAKSEIKGMAAGSERKMERPGGRRIKG